MRRVLATVALAVATLSLSTPAHAADGDAQIAHVQTDGGKLSLLVSLPAGTQPDLSGVTASLDGTPLDATATSTQSGTTISRTAVLAIDTSESMAAQGRFGAAKTAALSFLDAVPADVKVGVVTFDNTVTVALDPTTDRGQARGVVGGLALHRGTHLYDGLLAAVNAAGTDGQRSVVLLSDGADTGSSAKLAAAAQAVTSTHTALDAVALGLTTGQKQVLGRLAAAGKGSVIRSTGSALTQAFQAEADVLAHQVLVTAPLPAGLKGHQANVAVTVPTSTGTLSASVLAPITPTAATPATAPSLASDSGWGAPGWLLYAGTAVLALGLVGAALLLVPGKPAPMSITDRLAAYTSQSYAASGIPSAQKPASEPMLEQAKAAAAGLLERNEQLDQRLTQRLTAAGSQLKPSEWLLLHFGIVVGAVLVGALLGGGNLLVGLLFGVIGAVLPLVYLRWAAGRRRKAFDAALPETLQLLAGALSAGLSLPQAVDTITREGPDPINGEFKRVLVETRIGVSVEDAFEGVAERFNSKDFAWVVMAIRIQRQVGGNLAELLTTVAGTMRERAFLRRQVNSLAAEGKLSAIILSVLPPGVAAFVFLTQPGYLTPMYSSPLGWAMLCGAVGWLSLGIFWMSRLVKVEI
ncbi:type II secretion system F family protein [Nocardioides montaniterrae]